MDDITSTISKLLENPESLSALKNMAQSVMLSISTESGSDGLLPEDMSKIIKVVSRLRSNSTEDNNTRLLMSLRPYVSEAKQQKIDEAVKIMKLVSLLPLIKETGIL